MASPYSDKAGFVRGQRSGANRGWVTLYVAAEQGIDVGSDKWAVVCETHGTIVGVQTRAAGVTFLQSPEFCEACMAQRTDEPKPVEEAKPTTRFTFKREERATGLAGVANPTPNVQIKLNKKQVGALTAPSWRDEDNKWKIRLVVKDEKEKSGWRWVQLKARFETEEEGRTWIETHAPQLIALNLHQLES